MKKLIYENSLNNTKVIKKMYSDQAGHIDYHQLIKKNYFVEDVMDIFYEEEVSKQISDSQVTSLTKYTDSYFQELNEYMINNKGFNLKLEQMKEDINFSLNVSIIPFSLTLYHGTDQAMFGNVGVLEYAKTHDFYHCSTFMSTSLNKNQACGFINNSDDSVLITIDLNPNQKALWMKWFSIYKIEKEVLLPSNLDLSIDDVKKQKSKTLVKSHII